MLTKEQWRKQWQRQLEMQWQWATPGETDRYRVAAMRHGDMAIDCGDLWLQPLSERAVLLRPHMLTDLAWWRREAKAAYPGDPEWVDWHSYGSWLDVQYFPEPRLLWLIYPAGNWEMPVGHLGFRLGREPAPGCELDGVLANPSYKGKGYMWRAFRHIDDLVRPDWWVVFPVIGNEAAMATYTRWGFRPDPDAHNIYAGRCERWVWRRCEHTGDQASVALAACQGPQEGNQNI